MTDLSTTTTLPAATQSPAPEAQSAPESFSAAQVQAIVDTAVARAVAASQPTVSAPVPENPPSATSLFQKGALVRHTHFDPYDGRTRTRHGIVVEVLPAEGENGFARSVVGWFESVSGPIGDHELEAD